MSSLELDMLELEMRNKLKQVERLREERDLRSDQAQHSRERRRNSRTRGYARRSSYSPRRRFPSPPRRISSPYRYPTLPRRNTLPAHYHSLRLSSPYRDYPRSRAFGTPANRYAQAQAQAERLQEEDEMLTREAELLRRQRQLELENLEGRSYPYPRRSNSGFYDEYYSDVDIRNSRRRRNDLSPTPVAVLDTKENPPAAVNIINIYHPRKNDAAKTGSKKGHYMTSEDYIREQNRKISMRSPRRGSKVRSREDTHFGGIIASPEGLSTRSSEDSTVSSVSMPGSRMADSFTENLNSGFSRPNRKRGKKKRSKKNRMNDLKNSGNLAKTNNPDWAKYKIPGGLADAARRLGWAPPNCPSKRPCGNPAIVSSEGYAMACKACCETTEGVEKPIVKQKSEVVVEPERKEVDEETLVGSGVAQDVSKKPELGDLGVVTFDSGPGREQTGPTTKENTHHVGCKCSACCPSGTITADEAKVKAISALALRSISQEAHDRGFVDTVTQAWKPGYGLLFAMFFGILSLGWGVQVWLLFSIVQRSTR